MRSYANRINALCRLDEFIAYEMTHTYSCSTASFLQSTRTTGHRRVCSTVLHLYVRVFTFYTHKDREYDSILFTTFGKYSRQLAKKNE